MCKFFNSYEEFPSEFALFPQNFTQLGKILQDRRSQGPDKYQVWAPLALTYGHKYLRRLPSIAKKIKTEIHFRLFEFPGLAKHDFVQLGPACIALIGFHQNLTPIHCLSDRE